MLAPPRGKALSSGKSTDFVAAFGLLDFSSRDFDVREESVERCEVSAFVDLDFLLGRSSVTAFLFSEAIGGMPSYAERRRSIEAVDELQNFLPRFLNRDRRI